MPQLRPPSPFGEYSEGESMTPKQRVLAKWPASYAFKYSPGAYAIFSGPVISSSTFKGEGITERAAWADAAKPLAAPSTTTSREGKE